MVTFLLILYSVIMVAIIITVVTRSRAAKKQLDTVAQSLNAESVRSGFSPGRRYSGQHGDFRYEFEYYEGSRNSPSYLKILTPCPGPGDFAIARETAFDRFFKNLGIAVEITTGEQLFDDNFYIKSNTVDFARAYFDDRTRRDAVVALQGQGFRAVEYNGKTMTVTRSPFNIQDFNEAMVQEAARSLSALAQNITAVYGQPTMPGIPEWKLKRNMVYVVTGLVGLTGPVSLIGLGFYTPLDGWDLFCYSLKYSLPALIVFTTLAIQLLKGRSNSHVELTRSALIAAAGIVLLGWGGTAVANGYYDRDTSTVHRTLVVGKHYTTSKNSTTYHATVQSWRPRHTYETFTISYSTYQSYRPYQSYMTVETRPGHLGFEWVVGYR